MKDKNYYFMISLMFSFLFVGCSSKSESKTLNLKDCSVSFPSNYSMKIHKDEKIDSVLIKPSNLINGMYIVYYDNDIQKKNGNFKTLVNIYSNHVIKKIGHLELIEATNKHMKSQVYFLVGKHFYIMFVKYNDDMKNVIKECNESWRW